MNTKKEIETKEERKILDYICAYGRVYLHELKSEFEELHVNYIEEIVKYLQTQGFVKEEVIKSDIFSEKNKYSGYINKGIVPTEKALKGFDRHKFNKKLIEDIYVKRKRI